MSTTPRSLSRSGVRIAIRRVAPDWGSPLTEDDYRTLAASGINRELADEAMLRRVGAAEGREIVGQKGSRDCAGILFPSYWPGEERPHTYRIRRDHPEWEQNANGALKPVARYLGAPKAGNRLYIPPGISPDDLQDVTIPKLILEGEKKALASLRIARHQTNELRFVPIAVAGVWNWKGVIGKATAPNGDRVDVKGVIADLSRIPWPGQTVIVLFDANVRTNDNVRWARSGIAKELAGRGAKVQFIDLPEIDGVNGIDDLLAAWGPERVLELFEKPTPAATPQIVAPPQFKYGPDGMFRITERRGEVTRTQLTNYNARIATIKVFDDGVTERREFEIEYELNDHTRRLSVSATEFATNMSWPIERMGPAAITFPACGEYARAAIQSQSLTAGECRVYTHTGWRQLNAEWVFLHAGGAIGARGAVESVNVQLPGALSNFRLRLPSDSDGLIAAVRASLEVMNPLISLPLRAATYRAVIGGADFVIHLFGETGTYKSELAALEQQSFGPDMNARTCLAPGRRRPTPTRCSRSIAKTPSW